ncbi:MAG: hypothetical protein ACJ8AI_01295, partial [Rhodopila sp.]
VAVTATTIVSLCTSMPTNRVDCSMTRPPVPEAPRQTIRRDPRSSTHRDGGSPLQAGYGHEVFCGGFAPHKPLIRLFLHLQRVLEGQTPDQLVAERLTAKPALTQDKPSGRAGPGDIIKARLIAESAKEVSQPDSRSIASRGWHGRPDRHRARRIRRGVKSGRRNSSSF